VAFLFKQLKFSALALLVLGVHEINVVVAPPTSPSKHSEDVGDTTGTVLQPSEMAQAYMTMLTHSGLSEEQAAAMVGHLKVESDNFQADLEYVPNAYGTRGRGHLQWTDSDDSGGRRSNFEAYATSKDLSPTSFEANSGFLLSEMQGNHGQHWTSGASYQGFLQTDSIAEASTYLQNHYIRPGVPHTERRLQAARNTYRAFKRQKDTLKLIEA